MKEIPTFYKILILVKIKMKMKNIKIIKNNRKKMKKIIKF